MDNLTSYDYKLLEFVKNNPNTEQTTIIDNFQKSVKGISFRLEQLSKGSLSDAYLDRRYYSSVASYTITEKGLSALQDYYLFVHNRKKELWLKNIWIPIIVSFVTTILTVHIVPMLPQMLKWCIDILSKIFS